MEEHAVADDQSHYEISLTAGQAFVAFVLLLLSLAAAFAFGLMIGKGQADDRLVVQKATPVVTEAALTPKKNEGRIVELGVEADDFQEETAPATETTASDSEVTATVVEEAPVATDMSIAALPSTPPAHQGVTTAVQTPPQTMQVTTYAQLLSTGDQKTAESLAVRLINRGFTAAYVERGSTDKGPIYRVRVRFDSESEARAAEPKLKEFSKEVWITTK